MTAPRRFEAPWTRNEEKALAAMIEDGATYSQVAARLERPRNSIAGKVRRMRLAGWPIVSKSVPLAASVSPKRAKPVEPVRPPSWVPNGMRQEQVAELLSLEHTFPQIARQLGITENAVREAFKKICRKLGPQAQ